jgi:amino acid transporter
MVAYEIQIAMTGIVFLYAICFAKAKHKLKDKAELFKETFRNLDAIVDTIAQFTIFISITSLVRIYTDATYFEIIFLQSLVTVQFFSLFTVFVVTLMAYPKEPANQEVADQSDMVSRPRKHSPNADIRIYLVALYFVVDTVLLIFIMMWLGLPVDKLDAINEVFASCPKYDYLSFSFLGFSITPNASSIIVFVIIVLVVVYVFFLIVIKGFAALSYLVTHWPWVCMAFLCCLLGLTIFWLLNMIGVRDIMEEVTGKYFQDNQWGFGQILALLMWAPVLLQTTYFCKYYKIPPYFLDCL